MLSSLWHWWLPQALDISARIIALSNGSQLSSSAGLSSSPSTGALSIALPGLSPRDFVSSSPQHSQQQPQQQQAPQSPRLDDPIAAFTRFSALVVFLLCGGYTENHPAFVEASAQPQGPGPAPKSNWRGIQRKASLSRLPVASGPHKFEVRTPVETPTPPSTGTAQSSDRSPVDASLKGEPLSVLQAAHTQHVRQAIATVLSKARRFQGYQLVSHEANRTARPPAVDLQPGYLNDPRFQGLPHHEVLPSPSKASRRLKKILLLQPLELPHYICQQELRHPMSDVIYTSLLRFYDGEGLLLALFETAFLVELPQSVRDPTTLFRGESSFAKLTSILFSSNEFLRYLKDLIKPLLSDLVQQDLNLEVDPIKHPNGQPGALENAARLVDITRSTLRHILATASRNCPPLLRLLYTIIRRRTRERFPKMETILIGGFFFLRFLCPAIVSPVRFNLVSAAPSPHTSRALILVSKLLQALSNGVLLDGSKEEYFSFPIFNEFITNNMDDVQNLLQELSVPPSSFVSMSSRSFLHRSTFMNERMAFQVDRMVSVLPTIEAFVQQNFPSLLSLVAKQSPLRMALIDYHAYYEPSFLRSIMSGNDSQEANQIHQLVSKLPEDLKSPIINASFHPPEISNSRISLSLLPFNLPSGIPPIWEMFHDRLGVLLSGFSEILKFWPTFVPADSIADRSKYLLSQLCFLHHLHKETFGSVLPTFFHSDILIWDSLANLLKEVILHAAHVVPNDPIAAQRALVLGAMQLRWTAAQIFGVYFPVAEE